MTPLDGFDTMLLMGLTDEAAKAKTLILDSLRFDRDFPVQVFEVTIRELGGLLTAYQLDGDERFLPRRGPRRPPPAGLQLADGDALPLREPPDRRADGPGQQSRPRSAP